MAASDSTDSIINDRISAIMACRGTEYEGSWITCLLAVYPLYQYIYAGYMKYQLDKSKRE